MGLDIYLYKIIDNGDEFHMFEGIASEKAKQFLGLMMLVIFSFGVAVGTLIEK